MKLHDLKTKVYQLAGVTTTGQLKARYADLQRLDMRCKASWQQALALIEPAFEAWLAQPPEAYKALFDEIASLAQPAEATVTHPLADALLETASELEDLAESYNDDASRDESDLIRSQRLAEIAKLN